MKGNACRSLAIVYGGELREAAAILWESDDPKRVRLSPLVEDKNHPVLIETEARGPFLA